MNSVTVLQQLFYEFVWHYCRLDEANRQPDFVIISDLPSPEQFRVSRIFGQCHTCDHILKIYIHILLYIMHSMYDIL